MIAPSLSCCSGNWWHFWTSLPSFGSTNHMDKDQCLNPLLGVVIFPVRTKGNAHKSANDNLCRKCSTSLCTACCVAAALPRGYKSQLALMQAPRSPMQILWLLQQPHATIGLNGFLFHASGPLPVGLDSSRNALTSKLFPQPCLSLRLSSFGAVRRAVPLTAWVPGNRIS